MLSLFGSLRVDNLRPNAAEASQRVLLLDS